MHHLNLETLARLVDEPPTAEEATHLERCAACAAELEAMKRQSLELRALPDPEMPELVRVRIAKAIETGTMPAPAVRRVNGVLTRVAAAIAIFVLGAAAGALGVAPRLVAVDGPATRVAATPAVGSDPAAEAAAYLAAAEAEYMRALSRFAQLTYSDDGMDPLNRLAALEGIVLTTRSALREAPADPLINGYHLTALGQRDELLRRIEAVEPSGDEWF